MLNQKLTGASGPSNYIEDVFSTYLYTGTGSAQTITNGIDLAGKGGLVWIKRRDNVGSHKIIDSARGWTVGSGAGQASPVLNSDTTNAQAVNTSGTGGPYDITSVSATGYSIGPDWNGNGNTNTATYASWTFRKQPKFFDCGTGTTSGSSNKRIAHTLGTTPGCIIVKNISSTGGDWYVWHRSLASSTDSYLKLNTAAAVGTSSGIWGSSGPTSTDFGVNENVWQGANGEAYVWYAFAHDAGGFGLTGTDNVISCGVATTGVSTDAVANLGWEPQWIMYKCSGSAGSWKIFDNMRGLPVGGNDAVLYADSSTTESSAFDFITPSATGFSILLSAENPNQSYIYIAIRRGPMKVPTDGTKVFAPVVVSAPTGNQVVTTNFPVDMCWSNAKSDTSYGTIDIDRLRSNSTANNRLLQTQSTNAEGVNTWGGISFQSNTTIIDSVWSYLAGGTSNPVIYWNFGRAPSFFDEVCYTGTGANQTIAHNLGVVPELIIAKDRTSAYGWPVSFGFTSTNQGYAFLNTTAAGGNDTYTNVGLMTAQPTASNMYLVSSATMNGSGDKYVAYLFATCPGVSKVGSYTGNGSSQTINCGFTAGARFILIKRTDSTGDWYVWDTARGIVSGNDPHLSLNTTSAEVTTDDTIDPDSTGFVVNQLSATNVNVSSATYIYLAIA